MAVATEHRVSREDVIWAFGPDLEPVLEVEPGAVVTFETNDCFTGQIASEADLVTAIDFARVNSATGPVAVGGAEPGEAAASATPSSAWRRSLSSRRKRPVTASRTRAGSERMSSKSGRLLPIRIRNRA